MHRSSKLQEPRGSTSYGLVNGSKSEHVWCCPEAANMDAQAVDYGVPSQLAEIRHRLDQVASIAKAAETCAAAGNIPKALEIALD